MTMNTNCIDCMEVEKPGRISMALVKHCQWAESDARFLRMICASSREEAVVGEDLVVDGYACRQRFLRSYKFSRKEETVARRTRRWWRVKRSTATGRHRRRGTGRRGQGQEGEEQQWRRFLIVCQEVVFHFPFPCAAKADADDMVLRARPETGVFLCSFSFSSSACGVFR
ncbi:hypothetical protein NL676_023043 [Syzygium grande]|nr:hypothetical protein NL676_023043 [Syzygium grande]